RVLDELAGGGQGGVPAGGQQQHRGHRGRRQPRAVVAHLQLGDQDPPRVRVDARRPQRRLVVTHAPPWVRLCLSQTILWTELASFFSLCNYWARPRAPGQSRGTRLRRRRGIRCVPPLPRSGGSAMAEMMTEKMSQASHKPPIDEGVGSPKKGER